MTCAGTRTGETGGGQEGSEWPLVLRLVASPVLMPNVRHAAFRAFLPLPHLASHPKAHLVHHSLALYIVELGYYQLSLTLDPELLAACRVRVVPNRALPSASIWSPIPRTR